MKKKKKMALYAASGLLATSLAVGGATYALFKDDVTNGPNNVTAGTLEITAKRDDVPNIGPMFYSENAPGNFGGMATGEWAPGDKHTRGLFLDNTGSLEAKLKTIKVFPADASGNVVTSGAQYDDDILFSRQANIKIWDIQQFDASGGWVPMLRANASEMDMVMEIINDGYEIFLNNNPNADLEDQVTAARLVQAVNILLLERLNGQGNTTDNRHYKVVRMYNEPLKDLVDNNFDASSYNIKLQPDQAVLLGFTVEMKRRPGGGIDRNSMQGKSVYFNFGTDWVQTRNN
jgi:spore coat-associated protein N